MESIAGSPLFLCSLLTPPRSNLCRPLFDRRDRMMDEVPHLRHVRVGPGEGDHEKDKGDDTHKAVPRIAVPLVFTMRAEAIIVACPAERSRECVERDKEKNDREPHREANRQYPAEDCMM